MSRRKKDYDKKNPTPENDGFKKAGNPGKRDDGKPKAKFVVYDKIHSNDVAWYNKYPVQYNLATQVPTWAHVQGTPYRSRPTIPFCEHGSVTNELLDEEETFAGVLVADFAPTLGIATNQNDPVNKAFNVLMQELYAKTSGSSLNFQQADLAMLVISFSSIASAIAAAKRALETRGFWITRNVNYPRTLCAALMSPTTYDDMIKNYNSYVIRLNELIDRFNYVKIPAWFDIFARHYSLAHNVYLDEDSDFGQIFAYRPTYIWEYQDTEHKCTVHPLNYTTIDTLLNDIDEVLTNWNNSQDVYTITGALRRAFPDKPTTFIETFVPGTQINPIVDEYMSMQLMNATICGYMMTAFADDNYAGWEITQDPEQNIVIFNPSIETEDNASVGSATLMRVLKDKPTADDNMEMTRLTVQFDLDVDNYLSIRTCGTEIVHAINIYSTQDDLPMVSIYDNAPLFNSTVAVDVYRAFKMMKALAPFRYIPRIVFLVSNMDDTAIAVEIGDQYNYCTIEFADLANLHKTAGYSIWSPKSIG